MLIMLVENNADELRRLQSCVAECYPNSDIMPFADSKKAKLVFISDTPDYAEEAWKYYVNDYLLKPITTESVRRTLTSCSAEM